MATYYDWVNIDKKEYICPNDFGIRNKMHESDYENNPLLGALYSLLANEWKDDKIILLGDFDFRDETNPTLLKRLYAEMDACGQKGYIAEYVWETYKKVSTLFKDVDHEFRYEIDYMLNHDYRDIIFYGMNKEVPYDKLFTRGPAYFRYTINHSKKEFFDMEKTRHTYINDDGGAPLRINPISMLLAYPGSGDKCTGLWLGDSIEVSMEPPSAEYKDMSEEYHLGF